MKVSPLAEPERILFHPGISAKQTHNEEKATAGYASADVMSQKN